MTSKAPARISSFEDASTAKWLASALAPTRGRTASVPSAEAVARIRTRVFGEAQGSSRKGARILAA
jgi:hypothetical protein